MRCKAHIIGKICTSLENETHRRLLDGFNLVQIEVVGFSKMNQAACPSG